MKKVVILTISMLIISGCNFVFKGKTIANKSIFTIDNKLFKKEVTDYFELNKFTYIKPKDTMFMGMKNSKGFSFEIYGQNLNQISCMKINVPISATYDDDMKKNVDYLEQICKCTSEDDNFIGKISTITKYLEENYYKNGAQNKKLPPISLKDKNIAIEIKDCVLYINVTPIQLEEKKINQKNSSNNSTSSK